MLRIWAKVMNKDKILRDTVFTSDEDFDYENFFHSKGWGNKSVIQVDFQATINGCLNEIILL